MRGPRDFGFLLRPRWLIGTVVVVLAAAVMVNLGFWQIRRLQQSIAHNRAIEARIHAPAQPLAQALARYDLGAALTAPDSAAYRHVTVSGTYDAAGEVLLRSRSEGGHPGFHVLTPLRLADGKALLVDRGWVPYTDSDPPIPAAAPPSGTVTLTGLLRRPDPEPSGMFKAISPQDPATGPLKKTFYANPKRLQGQFSFPLVDAYLQLSTQSPAQTGELPVTPDPPVLTNGSHLSYTIQWFSFALITLIGYAVAVDRRARERGRGSSGDDGAGSDSGRDAVSDAGEGARREPPSAPGGVPSGD